MEKSEKRYLALEYLYDRYRESEDGDDVGFVDWNEALSQTGLSRGELGVLFEDLVDLELATTNSYQRRKSGSTTITTTIKGMAPKDGFVWSTVAGRKIVEAQRSSKENDKA